MGLLLLVLGLSSSNCTHRPRLSVIPKWDRFEKTFTSALEYTHPLQQAELKVVFTSPENETKTVYGFWDGKKNWRVRFCPNVIGTWNYRTECSDSANLGLHDRKGTFVCTASLGTSRFSKHGAVRVSRDGHYFVHEDNTPFFWLGDTAWNGPMRSTEAEWEYYVRERQRQKFSAVQWVTTQWRASPGGDIEQRLAYTGKEKIVVNPEFFQRLDARVDRMNRAGLLSVPVLLWAINGGSNPAINPGVSLPEDQAILLARYMVARWQGHHVVWILNGDGDYRGEKADKWKKIGRAVFGSIDHAPVTVHPGGNQWVLNEFKDEKWLDISGYQSGHADSENNLKWIISGPPSTEWKLPPPRPFISLEAPYENHAGGTNNTPMSDDVVRRAHYFSLLIAPPAGITYGAHGVWGWDDGTKPPVDHPRTGTPLPWSRAVKMPGAEQMTLLHDYFNGFDFWRLRPAPEVLAAQPGRATPRNQIMAARTEARDLVVIYIPQSRRVSVRLEALPIGCQTSWFNPRTGETMAGVAVVTETTCEFPTPGEGDWLLTLKAAP